MWRNVVWNKFTDLSQDRDAYPLRVKAGELRKRCTRLHGVKSNILQPPLWEPQTLDGDSAHPVITWHWS